MRRRKAVVNRLLDMATIIRDDVGEARYSELLKATREPLQYHLDMDVGPCRTETLQYKMKINVQTLN